MLFEEAVCYAHGYPENDNRRKVYFINIGIMQNGVVFWKETNTIFCNNNYTNKLHYIPQTGNVAVL